MPKPLRATSSDVFCVPFALRSLGFEAKNGVYYLHRMEEAFGRAVKVNVPLKDFRAKKNRGIAILMMPNYDPDIRKLTQLHAVAFSGRIVADQSGKTHATLHDCREWKVVRVFKENQVAHSSRRSGKRAFNP